MNHPWNTRRSSAIGENGMVCSDNPAASAIGIDVLRDGGNAADAAVAMAGALNVTQPWTCGIGGDAWILYYDAKTKKITCLNGSGKSGHRFCQPLLAEKGYERQIPLTHPLTITVPGAFAAWVDLKDTFGSSKSTLSSLWEPAVELATVGFALNEVSSDWWSSAVQMFNLTCKTGKLPERFLAPGQAGDIIRFPELGRTLKLLAIQGKDEFYKGATGQLIANAVQSAGGVLTAEDLAAHETAFCEPISTNYAPHSNPDSHYTVWETPLNTQAIVTLEALNIIECLPWSIGSDSSTFYHSVLESLRISFSDLSNLWKAAEVSVPSMTLASKMLDKDFALKRAQNITFDSATGISELNPLTDLGDTTYFCVSDKYGNACSAVWSNYNYFGTTVSPDNCGFTLHNRGYHFWEYGHRHFQPCVRPFHTIMAGMVTDESNEFLSCFGCMGGQNQPQGHLQLLLNMFERNCSPQLALNSPRVRLVYNFDTNKAVEWFEEGVGSDVIRALQLKNHVLMGPVKGKNRGDFGRGHIITKGNWWKQTAGSNPNVYWGGCDPRADGFPLAY